MSTWRPQFIALGLLLSACSAYEMGGSKPAFQRIEIAPIKNASSRTGTHIVLHTKLADAFANDPRVKLGNGDAVLSTTVTDYRRQGFTTKPGDAFSFNSFRVTYEVRATLTTSNGAKVLFKDRIFSASTTLQTVGDAASEELSVAPTLFADIASQIRQAATTAW